MFATTAGKRLGSVTSLSKLLRAAGLPTSHPGELLLASVKRGFGDAHLATDLLHQRVCVGLLIGSVLDRWLEKASMTVS